MLHTKLCTWTRFATRSSSLHPTAASSSTLAWSPEGSLRFRLRSHIRLHPFARLRVGSAMLLMSLPSGLRVRPLFGSLRLLHLRVRPALENIQSRYIFALTPTRYPNIGEYANREASSWQIKWGCHHPRSTPVKPWSTIISEGSRILGHYAHV